RGWYSPQPLRVRTWRRKSAPRVAACSWFLPDQSLNDVAFNSNGSDLPCHCPVIDPAGNVRYPCPILRSTKSWHNDALHAGENSGAREASGVMTIDGWGNGGEGGIRTLGTLARSTVFET